MKKYLLIFICLLFLFTRIYKINEIPNSVYWDEASIGYSAYSIFQTGSDEWGKFLPIHFRAFGEFKLPVYIYSVVPFVKLFGLNEFSVRFPAVLFSLGIIILTYFLAKKISGNENMALFSSFFLSISPWFFIFSRSGYEATAGLMFYLLGIYLFLNTTKNSWFIFFSTVSLILSIYSYNSFRILVPLTIPTLLLIELNNFKKKIKQILPIILSILLLTFCVIPIYRLYVYDTGISRIQAVGSNPGSFLKNYLSHFDPNFLFIQGDKNLRSQQMGFGQLYLLDVILLPMGLLYIISSKAKLNYLILYLLLIAPVSAAITKESPHGLRAISSAVFLSIISAFGVLSIKRYFSKKNFLDIGVTLTLLIFFANYFINFITIYPNQSSSNWQYGYKKIYTDFASQFSKYDQIIISDEYAQPYIFTLFYLKYDPNRFRQSVVRNNVSNWGFSTVLGFDKFKFGKIKNLVNNDTKNSLIFASEKEKLMGINPIKEIKFINGMTAFWVYKI